MIPRGRLDISTADLWFALERRGSASMTRAQMEADIRAYCDGGERPGMVCLSVRSALDAFLHAVDWPPGSEVLMSAVTIPEMARIVNEHGFEAIPLDVDPQTLAPDLEQVRARLTPQTRAILIAHLFGSRIELSAIGNIARQHGVQVWEDVAQGFAADQFPGDVHADVSFFSFGMIKAQTALGGACVRCRDPQLADRCRRIIEQWPVQSSAAYRQRVRRAAVLQLIGLRSAYTLLANVANILKWDLDERLSRTVRGFPGPELFAQLRQQPCDALLRLLHRRLTLCDRRWIVQKTAMAEECRKLLPDHVVLGRRACFPSHWVLPIRSRDPQGLRAALWQRGYDAAIRGSQLRVIPPSRGHPDWDAPQATGWVPQLIYLPLHPALRCRDLQVIADIVTQFENTADSTGITPSGVAAARPM